MLLRESKCTFLDMEKGKIVENHEAVILNGVAIKPFKEEYLHKYHGQDENIGYVVLLDKARVIADYIVYGRSGQANYLYKINALHIMFLHYQS